jgi:superfamily II DNA/RNA helicase
MINFDLPSNSKLFKKRIQDVTSDINQGMSILTLIQSSDSEVFEKISKRLEKTGKIFEALHLKMDQFERFRYRCEDILRGVTHKRVQAYQINDVKKAILAVKESKSKFDLNPEDKRILAEAKKKEKPPKHLATVPDYLLPENMRKETKSYHVNRNDFEAKLAKRQRRPAKEYAPEETLEENPDNIAWQDLAPTSNRKLWKIRHRHSLAKKTKKPRRY